MHRQGEERLLRLAHGSSLASAGISVIGGLPTCHGFCLVVNRTGLWWNGRDIGRGKTAQVMTQYRRGHHTRVQLYVVRHCISILLQRASCCLDVSQVVGELGRGYAATLARSLEVVNLSHIYSHSSRPMAAPSLVLGPAFLVSFGLCSPCWPSCCALSVASCLLNQRVTLRKLSWNLGLSTFRHLLSRDEGQRSDQLARHMAYV
jgi:hypothetical protein